MYSEWSDNPNASSNAEYYQQASKLEEDHLIYIYASPNELVDVSSADEVLVMFWCSVKPETNYYGQIIGMDVLLKVHQLQLYLKKLP